MQTRCMSGDHRSPTSNWIPLHCGNEHTNFRDPRVWWLCAPKPLLPRGTPGNTAPLPILTAAFFYQAESKKVRGELLGSGILDYASLWLWPQQLCNVHHISCSPKTDINPRLGSWRRNFLATKKQTLIWFSQQLRNRYVSLSHIQGVCTQWLWNQLVFFDLALGKVTRTKMPRPEIRSQNALVI